MLRPAKLVVAALGLALAGCTSEGASGDPSVVVDKRRAASEKVENGTAYDRAAVDAGAAKKVVLPDTATVRRTAEAGPVRLFMAKHLGFQGHPPEPMSIREARKNMGCAVKAEEDGLVLATFGEFRTIEGGASMKLVAVVPEGLKIEQRKGLSGHDSAGREWHGTYLTKPADAKGGYWYGPASPAGGWRAVPDDRDPDRTAR
ncbi:MAG: hypothetical protein J2P46_06025 [Zavarzinella sp.]|nr:hypothetical protein [Zavarzinella sp.]